MKHKLLMEGLNCAHCAGKIEKAIADTNGFKNVSMVFPTKTLYLEHKDKNVLDLVQKITDSIEEGVTVRYFSKNNEKDNNSFFTKNLLLFIAFLFGIGAIIFEIFKISELSVMILSTVAIVLSGYNVFITGAKSLIKLKINENTLMAIAVIAAFALGQYIEGTMVTLLFGIGEMLEDKAIANSRKSIEALANIQSDTATIIDNGTEKNVEAESVEIGSIIIVKPYERVSLDGIVVDGKSSLDASAITGESLPTDCNVGTEVLSGMINGEGLLKIKTTKAYHDSTANRIIKLVEEASITKSHNEKLISRFAAIYTPIVVLLSVAIAIIPPLLGFGDFSEWIYRGLVCLVSSCPCAIVISVPLSYYSGIGAASKNGVLFKGGKYLEALAKADTMVFDKTGTLTEGKLEVVNIISFKNYSREEILSLAAACEKNSSHPIAKAIRNCYKGDLIQLENYKEKSGYGVSAVYKGKELICGSKKLLKENIKINATVFLIYDNELIGAIEVLDKVRTESKSIICKLKELGFKNLVMLTGDNSSIAEKVAKDINIDNYYGDLLPENKVEVVKTLKVDSKGVCFVGDGINDAPVLTTSDCGFAMGLGSDVAIESADSVLTSGNLTSLPKAIKIARKTLSTVKINLFFALAIKLSVIICAILGFAAIWMSVVADVGVCLMCVLYATRLLKIK